MSKRVSEEKSEYLKELIRSFSLIHFFFSLLYFFSFNEVEMVIHLFLRGCLMFCRSASGSSYATVHERGFIASEQWHASVSASPTSISLSLSIMVMIFSISQSSASSWASDSFSLVSFARCFTWSFVICDMVMSKM